MDICKKQHELIQLLYDYDKKFVDANYKIASGLSWDQISLSLNVTKDELNLIAGKPISDKDIEGDTRLTPPLYSICKPNGIASLASKKYLKESENWFDKHPKSYDFFKISITAIITGIISLLVGVYIAQQKALSQQQIDTSQDTAIDSLRGVVENFQFHLTDSSLHK